MAEDEESPDVTFDWSSAESMAVQPVNMFVVQAGPDSHVLNLGFVAPPLHGEGLERVPVHAVARIMLTPSTVAALLAGLAENVRRREEQQREQGAGNDE
jgi:hypothetical protein